MGSKEIQAQALIDTGADINTISFEIWEALGKPTLFEIDIVVGSFSGEPEFVEGICELPMLINGTNLLHEFFVVKSGQQVDPVILGQPWQREYDCCISWKNEGITYTCNKVNTFVPFVHNKAPQHAANSEEKL